MKYAVIAAGAGSRLAAEGVGISKPLIPLDGKPMIGRLIDILCDCDAESISVIVNEYMTDVAQYLASLKQSLPIPLNIVVKTTPDSMHSFLELAPHLGTGKFILTTVDTVFDPAEFRKYASDFASDTAFDGFMAVTDFIDDEKPLYVDIDEHSIITAYKDEPFEGVRYISAGIYGLIAPRDTDLLHVCAEQGIQRMRNFQRALVAVGRRLKAYPIGRVIDVDHPGDISKAELLIHTNNE